MRRLSALFSLAVLAWLGPGSRVEAELAYVTSPKNELLRVDFDAGSTEVVVRDHGKLFRGLVVRRDAEARFRLIVANLTHGGDLRIYDPATGEGERIAAFRRAHGVALSQSGNLFAVNRDFLGKDQVVLVPRRPACDANPSAPGCFPGGYGPLQFIDFDVRVPGEWVKELADVRVAYTSGGGLVEAGQLVVLVRRPAMVIAYTSNEDMWDHCPDLCEPEVIVPSSELEGFTPAGLEVASNSLLIATEQGAILKAAPGAAGLEVRPFAFLPGKGAKLSVGTEEGSEIVYATVKGRGGSLHRFDVATGDPLGGPVKRGVLLPEGVGNETSAVVFTPTGTNVKITLPTMQAVFDNVVAAGTTDAVCDLYPRPDKPAGAPVLLSELGFELNDTDVVIPPHIQPFRVGNPDTGALSYFICRVKNLARFERTFQLTEFEEQVLGYGPDCETFNNDPTHEARMFYAPDLSNGETNIIESEEFGSPDRVTGFTDLSTDCGCNVGRGWKFSFLMPAAQSELSVCSIEEGKLRSLGAIVSRNDAEYVFADNIAGPGCPAPATVPDELVANLTAALADADLGSLDDWNLLDADAMKFWGGAPDANGLLIGGGDVTFEFREAGFHHAFGVGDPGGTNTEEILRIAPPDHPVPAKGTSFTIPIGREKYVFYFENLTGIPGRVFSDGTVTPGAELLKMLVFQNRRDPGLFALLFDDAGAGPDRDFTDLVLTARGAVNTQCQVESLIDRSLVALAGAEQCGGTGLGRIATVLDNMTELRSLIQTKPGDFMNTPEKNVQGELGARAESAVFMACKLVGGEADVCPVQP